MEGISGNCGGITLLNVTRYNLRKRYTIKLPECVFMSLHSICFFIVRWLRTFDPLFESTFKYQMGMILNPWLDSWFQMIKTLLWILSLQLWFRACGSIGTLWFLTMPNGSQLCRYWDYPENYQALGNLVPGGKQGEAGPICGGTNKILTEAPVAHELLLLVRWCMNYLGFHLIMKPGRTSLFF